MGNPDLYYKRMLQEFVHGLLCNVQDDMTVAAKWQEEKSIEKLEEFIIELKNQIDDKHFYFEAGIAAQFVIDEVVHDNLDLNACAGGLADFEYFIGTRDEDEEED